MCDCEARGRLYFELQNRGLRRFAIGKGADDKGEYIRVMMQLEMPERFPVVEKYEGYRVQYVFTGPVKAQPAT